MAEPRIRLLLACNLAYPYDTSSTIYTYIHRIAICVYLFSVHNLEPIYYVGVHVYNIILSEWVVTLLESLYATSSNLEGSWLEIWAYAGEATEGAVVGVRERNYSSALVTESGVTQTCKHARFVELAGTPVINHVISSSGSVKMTLMASSLVWPRWPHITKASFNVNLSHNKFNFCFANNMNVFH